MPEPASAPLVSHIMPVWQPNREWLRASVASALAQRDCRLELIVVDDGCPEPAADLLGDVTDDRLRVIRIEHGGPAAARNAGLAAARGDRIRFMDADDVLTPDSTSRLASMMRGDAVVSYGSTVECDEELRPRATISSALQGNVVEACLLGRFSTRCPALLFPRRVVEAAGLWDPAFLVSGDWDFVLRALEHAEVVGDERITFYYRRHGRSLSRTADVAAGEIARRLLIRKYFERHPEQRGSSLERRAISSMYLDRARAYWHLGQYPAAIPRLVRGLATDPVGGTGALAGGAMRALGLR
jgi:glycosyltransferase involved in cell wall biosynthesis